MFEVESQSREKGIRHLEYADEDFVEHSRCALLVEKNC